MEQHASSNPTTTPNYGSTATTTALSPTATSSHHAIAGPSTSRERNEGHPGESGHRKRKTVGEKIGDALGRFNPQMTLKNTGSVARDHLALERTWLAWTRTSLSIASTGVALVQLFALSSQNSQSSTPNPVSVRIMQVAKPLGATTIAFAFLVLMIGSTRYFQVQYALTQNYFPPARVSPVVMSVIMLCLVVAVFAVVVSLTR